jgi:hypothetical protein
VKASEEVGPVEAAEERRSGRARTHA